MWVITLVFLISSSNTGSTEQVMENYNNGQKNDEPSKVFGTVEETPVINIDTGKVNVLVGCGGIIDFPIAQSSLVIDYKLGINYDNNERCVWTFNQSTEPSKYRWYDANVDVTLSFDGFEEGYDSLKVLTWQPSNGKLTSTTLKSQITFRLTIVAAMFLSFSSDETNVGTGFRFRLDVLSSSINPYYFAENFLFSSSSTRSLTYSSDHADNIVSTVINPTSPSTPFTFQIDSLNAGSVSGCTAQLVVYEIQPKDFVQRVRLCGSFTVPPASFDTTDPVIAMFWTRTDHNIVGFTYSW